MFCAPAFSGPPHLVPQVAALCFVFVTNGALPHQARTPVPKAAMIYKLASSHPTQAVDTSDNGRRVDGNGGGAAGTSLAGVGAVGAIGNHACEIPLLFQSTGTVAEPNISCRSRISRSSRALPFRAVRSPGISSLLGKDSPPPGDPVNHVHPLALVDAPSVPLKKRCFRIGTWNSRGRFGPSNSSKVATAKMIMKLEKVDVLVLTETHSLADSPPSIRGLNVLSHTSVSANRAGVAICALDNGHWTCLSSNVLVPGHAIVAELYNSVSTETFTLLGVYGDISSYAARTSFYEALYTNLSNHILAISMSAMAINHDSARPSRWHRCLAAGDWNFVEKDSDRYPYKVPSGDVVHCCQIFNDIKSLCMMTDSAGPSVSYKKHTFVQTTQSSQTFSRLDRIYYPHDGWSATPPNPIRTNHSDHHFVWSDCFITAPKVEIAVPAPRLPSLKLLDDGPFWPQVLSAWSDLSSGDVSLPSWSAFKRYVLRTGLSISKSRKKSVTGNWKSALRRDGLSSDELADITFDWHASQSVNPVTTQVAGGSWQSAMPAYDSRPLTLRCPRKAVLFPDALAGLSAARPVLSTPLLDVHVPPAPVRNVADLLDARLAAKRASQLKKYKDMEHLHTSEWFNLSSNKEADERGSHASVSVEGLHHSNNSPATTDLKHMLHIAQDHFRRLHTPHTMSTMRSASQVALLAEIVKEYGGKPAPDNVASRNFTLAEVLALRSKMPNTAPGPDGLPYGFYKALASKLDLQIKSDSTAASFWDVFTSLANEIRLNGSNRCDFKLANLSLFFKKGDPTLVSNYRPISSMNTDCKMYTNLVNRRISPWVVTKIHPDQAGFVPGRLITDHTRLASEVAHLSNSTNTDGYIISLDQAKAYDKTDIAWLLRVLSAMGIPEDLISLIEDVTHCCHTRVRINSGLSSPFVLNVGLRQGDPLSPILYDFSIELLGMHMRKHLTGISCCGLPPAKLIMYTDDMNLFMSTKENFRLVRQVMTDTMLAIGCRFNLDKTDILVVGSLVHHTNGIHDDVTACFEGAYVLPADSPLRILGVWVNSPDRATPRWKQIVSHIKKLVSQWSSIGASMLNRVVLAKALMMSRCYYLLDGNIHRFVRGSYSSVPYRLLESPLSVGGLNCPSLTSRALAYDAKFMSDLISGPASTPWRAWTFADLDLASVFNSSTKKRDFPGRFNPLLQSCHC